MTLAADLRRARRIETRGLNDRLVGRARDVERVAPQGIAVRARVRVAGTVARFARDAEFRGARIGELRCNWSGAKRRVELRPPVRRMACDAHGVPSAGFGHVRRARRHHDRGAPGNPGPLRSQPNGRKLSKDAAVPRRVPEDLLIMRSGGHHHLAFYATGSGWGQAGVRLGSDPSLTPA